MAARKQQLIGALISFALLGYATTVQAYTFSIDNFRVNKNGSLLFNDPFTDGSPPPSAPNFANGTPASYSVFGTLGPESGGTLTIDSSGAGLSFNPLGQPRLFQRARLLTNIDPTNLTLGLKDDDTFSVTGRFDLILPGPLTERYGIRLSDQSSTNVGDDVLDLSVRRRSDGTLAVQLRRLDFAGGTITNIASTPLDSAHDQIALTLSRLSATNDAITASFFYLDGGVPGLTTTFAATPDIFNGENWTRADFSASTPVPEPSVLLLLGSSLAALVGWSRKKFNG